MPSGRTNLSTSHQRGIWSPAVLASPSFNIQPFTVYKYSSFNQNITFYNKNIHIIIKILIIYSKSYNGAIVYCEGLQTLEKHEESHTLFFMLK
jgi:hypothetical protein